MLLVALALSSAMFVSCNKYDDDIERLDSAVAALQATVQTLQNEIAGGAVITNVTNTEDGIKVTLSNGNSYNVQNGKDGQNGTNGKDGSVVEVGENGNWFINGEDTGLAAAGKDGKDGQNGTSASTVYYYPGEAGVWVKVTVSPEGEKTEEATTMKWLPAGTLTAVYENGALTLYGVQGVEGGLVVAGSAHLASLAFVPEVMTSNLGMPIVSSYYVEKYASYDKKKDKDIYNKVLSNNLEMTYRVNPTNANLSKTVFSFIDRVVATKADGDSTSLLNFVSYKAVEGGIVVTATANEIDYAADQDENFNIFALKAVNEDGCEIVSDYARFDAEVLSQFSLWCGSYDKKGKFVPAYEHQEIDNPTLAEEVNANLGVEVKDLKTLADIAKVDEAYDMSLLLHEEAPCAQFAYDKSFDLNKLVRLFAGDVDMAKADFDVTYKFSKPETYKSPEDKVTNQQYYVELSEDGIVTVNSALPTKRSAIGRTPIFKVEAYVGETLIADTYVQLQILEVEPEDKDAIDIWVNGGVIEYSDIVSKRDATKKNPATVLALSWERVNAEIYEVLGMSPTQFKTIYGEPAWSHKVVENKKGVKKDGCPAGVEGEQTLTGAEEINTATTAVGISFLPASLELGKDTVFVTFSSENSTVYGPVTVAFTYDIKHDKAFPALNTDYQVADNAAYIPTKLDSKGNPVYAYNTLETVQTKGKLVNSKWALQNTIKEFIEDYADDLVLPGNHTDLTFDLLGVVFKDTLRNVELNPVVKHNKKVYDLAQLTVGATLSDNTLDGELKLTDALYASEDSRLYVIRMTVLMANGGKCQKDFAVKFVRPYTMSVDAVTLKTMAAPDKADLSKLVTVKDFSGKVLYAINKNHPDYTVAKDGSINWDELGVTEYAVKYYGLTADDFKNIEYGVDATGFGEGTLKTDGSELIWNNMGGDLQVNKSAKSVITLTIEGIAATTAKGNVTVLSTANSMDAE